MMAGSSLKKRPVVLIVLSGFGWSPQTTGNAIALARTPFLDQYRSKYAHTLLEASGERVGLPKGQAGNSEVSHLIIGAGRTVPMEVTRIDEAIAEGTFFENPALVAAIDAGRNATLHLMGLLSDGGVHSMNTHLYALVRMAAARGVSDVRLHLFTDGRDTPQTSGAGFIAELCEQLQQIGTGRIATITGRYYAMDRDNRWDRIRRAYDAITRGAGRRFNDPVGAVEASYDEGVTDEFIEPIIIAKGDEPAGTVQPGDSVIFFNFRADRARQLTRAFTGLSFDGFERELIPNLNFATFTQYDRSFNTSIVFAPMHQHNTLAEIFAERRVSNLRVAETETFARVTWFFNGGHEHEMPYESRIEVASPQVARYDQQPEMSAFRVTDKVCRALDEHDTDVYVINFANGDLVSHTGNLNATIKAVEAVDTCLGWVVGTVERIKGTAIITADHGNCEQMTDPETGAPHTAHTCNPVPFILCDTDFSGTLREGGALEDIAPTMLELLGLEQPAEMTGRSLLQPRTMEKS
ncbi:MAG: 2,3-bisphosphoglycerate-independent phosphoglycerate mutase [Blastocatellia bacterium]